jgi:hypothetical protein
MKPLPSTQNGWSGVASIRRPSAVRMVGKGVVLALEGADDLALAGFAGPFVPGEDPVAGLDFFDGPAGGVVSVDLPSAKAP